MLVDSPKSTLCTGRVPLVKARYLIGSIRGISHTGICPWISSLSCLLLILHQYLCSPAYHDVISSCRTVSLFPPASISEDGHHAEWVFRASECLESVACVGESVTTLSAMVRTLRIPVHSASLSLSNLMALPTAIDISSCLQP
jgi:hypothetical protein